MAKQNLTFAGAPATALARSEQVMWRPIARLVGLTLLLDAAVAAVLSAASLKEYDALLAERPTAVVAVYAPWCGHSRALLPEYDAAAALLGRRVPLIKVDGTVAEDVATRLDVKGYPTLFFVRDGVADEFEVRRHTVAQTRRGAADLACSGAGGADRQADRELGQGDARLIINN